MEQFSKHPHRACKRYGGFHELKRDALWQLWETLCLNALVKPIGATGGTGVIMGRGSLFAWILVHTLTMSDTCREAMMVPKWKIVLTEGLGPCE